jgi:hypothetical protein
VKPTTFARKAFNRIKAEVRWQQRLHQWDARRFDRKLGVDTAGVLEPTELTVRTGDAGEGITYLGTQPRLAQWWLTGLPHSRGGFTFVDMGSGKGRVLLFAAQAGFGRAVGVEFAEELHATAAANARIASERGLSIEPLLGDAGAFEFPEEPVVVHFSNPFHEPVMVRVIANLTASYKRRQRPVIVVYQQMTVERPGHVTNNLALLDAVPFLTGRTLAQPTGVIDRRLLAPFTVRIYESLEVLRPS